MGQVDEHANLAPNDNVEGYVSMTPTPNADQPANPPSSISRRKLLRALTEAVGLSGLILILGNIFNAPNMVTNGLALSLILIWTVARLGREYLIRVRIVLLSTLCLTLATSLAWVIHSKKDPWREWGIAISDSVNSCSDKGDPCIAEALTRPYPAPMSGLVISRLNSDLTAGSYFLQNEAIKKMLDSRLGIKRRFLGTGFAQPSFADDYGEARVPEYLCPNSSENDEAVISWQLGPKQGYQEWTLEEIIKGERPTFIRGKKGIEVIQPTNSKDKRDRLLANIEGNLDLRARLPAVVRFQQLSASSTKVGKTEAARVFFIHLGSVWKAKLKDAAALSGYTLDDSTDKKYFIWVFVPSDENEVVRATWDEILSHIKDKEKPWIK